MSDFHGKCSLINEACKAGFHSFVEKTLDPQRFPQQLKRLLNNQRVWVIEAGSLLNVSLMAE